MLLAEYDERKTMEYIRRESRAEGEALLSELFRRLLADSRMEDLRLAAESEKERKRLYREYGLLKE